VNRRSRDLKQTLGGINKFSRTSTNPFRHSPQRLESTEHAEKAPRPMAGGLVIRCEANYRCAVWYAELVVVFSTLPLARLVPASL
jgi:hypothetical protein